ncbi:hypothetical protein [Nitrosomonas supralitoralis]|uniref:hypothetical protein n=1 Tax=Nitrosomonas supralitoralis TaxID=2116706 RepID=UPI000D0FAE97|nr:hypothetical protein [Nitrosomonas supralitoralis]
MVTILPTVDFSLKRFTSLLSTSAITLSFLTNKLEYVNEPWYRFKLTEQAQQFLENHAAVGNLLNLSRHLDCRDLTQVAFAALEKATLA